ncbi:uncharacterized protein MAM_05804 [Metarhizium album ARSEF 1941]|uniref:ATP-dependent RNA helicase Mrh4 n=1 Tax=Metarhizium album (strain ARSEF 1941) TaxID=1081103 RepID=A0A0B2WQB9_METAS|nr:uncharacterized protein MAM_05804 [Metarhizium album ARSEF 1941]KHN96218.1 hypothetical protein MAM_05804 [Metarhizium album ARSEF 1941]
MPRPKRARRAPPTKDPNSAQAAAVTDGHDEQRGRTRARTRPTRSAGARLSLDEEDATRAANRTRDAALPLDSLANEGLASTTGPDDTRSSVEVGRRAMATPATRRDTTGLDLADDDVFGDLDDSFADGDFPEAPRSAASSSAGLGHFKTRPRSRQSSIIGRNDPPIRPSSRGTNTSGVSSSFNIGVFRRRAREPSILATSRRARSQTGSAAGSAASSRAGSVVRDLELESEGEFAPEAESTPLNQRRRSRRSQEHEARRPSPSPSPSPSGRRRSLRKRKSDGDAQSENPRPDKVARVEASGGIDIGSDSELSELASPSPPAAHSARAMTPDNMDEINAPPASSDSEADDNVWPDIHTLAKKRRRPSVNTPLRNDRDDLSDASSPPSLTHSPNYVARARGSKHQRSPPLTTADLTSLLPKRRYKRNREDSDDDTEDEGGEGGQDARPRRRKGSRPPSRGSSRQGQNVLKPKYTPVSVRRSARTASKTLRPDEDKENESEDEQENSQFQPLPDDTFDTGASVADHVQNADELKRASRKFQEVDQWELSFEEVTEESSPPGAR